MANPEIRTKEQLIRDFDGPGEPQIKMVNLIESLWARTNIQGPIFGIFGTSITEQNSRNVLPPNALPARAWFTDGYATWLRILSKQQVNIPINFNFGVSGNYFKDMLVRMDAVLAAKLDFCIVEGGTNDFAILSTEESYQIMVGVWMQIVTIIRNAGTTVIVLPAPPRAGGVLTAAQVKMQQRFYNFQREFCLANEGYYFADYIGTWVDQTSSVSNPLPLRVRADNVHPQATGAYWMGKTLWDVIEPLLPKRPTALLTMADIYDAVSNPTGNLLISGATHLGMLAGTGGVQSANAGLTYAGNGFATLNFFARSAATSTTTVTLDKENPRTDAGRMSGERQLVKIAAASGGGADEVYYILYTMALPNFSAGDWYYAECGIEILEAPVNVKSLELYLIETRPTNSQSASDLSFNTLSGILPSVLWNGVLRTAPIPKQSDSTAVQLYVRARLDTSAGAASIKFALADVACRKVNPLFLKAA